MKGKTQIKMDFAKANKDAKKLDTIADQLQRLANTDFEKTMLNLSAAWTGDNSRIFLQKEGLVQDDIKKTAVNLRNVAADIRRVAKRIYEAEMRAYEIARRRKT